LGKALAERGHNVWVVKPVYSDAEGKEGFSRSEYGGLVVDEAHVPVPPSHARKLGMGKAWQQGAAARMIEEYSWDFALWGGVDVLHGQHMVSSVAASRAAIRAAGNGGRVVSVATVRDYWPLCSTSTRLFAERNGQIRECVDCHKLRSYLRCATVGKTPVAYLPSLARWARTARMGRALAECDGVIGVSRYVRDELARSGRVPKKKLAAIPNLVHLPSVEKALGGRWPLPDIEPEEPFLMFAGKLDYNKGAQMLPEVVARSGVKLPVVVAGEGPLQAKIEADARQSGLDFRFYGWLDNDATVLLMGRARALLFPSAWQEPLSRVLLEGCAAGAAIVALDTGGTRDITTHGQSGWLAGDMDNFVVGVQKVSHDLPLNMRLREGARVRAEERFSSERVSARVEGLYRRLLEAQRG
jgi:glycosyltransferase involved in cell wall biosynthesis